jgi:hypothetical protein
MQCAMQCSYEKFFAMLAMFAMQLIALLSALLFGQPSNLQTREFHPPHVFYSNLINYTEVLVWDD